MHLVIVNEPVSLVASDEVVVVEKELHPVQKEPVHSVVNHLQERDLVAGDVEVQTTCFVKIANFRPLSVSHFGGGRKERETVGETNLIY